MRVCVLRQMPYFSKESELFVLGFAVFKIEISVSIVFCSIRIFMEDRIRVFRVSNSFGITSQKAKMCCKITPFHDCPNSTEFGSFKLTMYLGLIFWSFQVELQARLSIIGGVRIGPQHFNIRDYPKNNNVTLYS